jgi:hypothetical protein
MQRRSADIQVKTMSNSLVVQGKAISVNTLPGARQFVAGKFGITLPKVEKGQKGLSMKEIRTLAEGKGVTKDQIKAANKEYDALRVAFYRDSAVVAGMLVADPTLRKAVKVSTNKKGEAIGATITVRKERSASATKDAQIANLTALVQSLSEKLGLQQVAAALPAQS